MDEVMLRLAQLEQSHTPAEAPSDVSHGGASFASSPQMLRFQPVGGAGAEAASSTGASEKKPVAKKPGKVAIPKGFGLMFQRTATTVRDEMATATKWSNCGRTADAFVSGLEEEGAKFSKQTFTLIGAGADEAADTGTRVRGAKIRETLEAALRAPVEVPTLVTIDIDSVHVFTVERHPDGKAYLAQAYQGRYSAQFWNGMSDRVDVTGTEAGELRAMREQWGNNAPIDAAGLAELCSRFMECGRWSDSKTAAAWQALPLAPRDGIVGTRASETRHESGTPIRMQVVTRAMTNPDQVLESLGGERGDRFTQLILQK